MSDGRRTIAITGAGGALGGAVSARLAGEPATDLVLSDVSRPALEATVSGLPECSGSVETVLADVSELDQVEGVVQLAIERFGHLDVLISNAGVLSPNGRIHNLKTEDWERAFRINLMGAVNGIRAAVPVMREQKAGSIVLTASVSRSDGVVARRSVLCDESRGDPARQGRGRRICPRRDPRRTACARGPSGRRSTPTCQRRRSTRSRPGTRSGSARPQTWPGPIRISRVTRPAGPPARRWSSTAATRLPDRTAASVSPAWGRRCPG